MNRLAVLFFWVGILAAQNESRNPHTTPEDVAAGAKTFRSHCAPCHGYTAEGGRGPNLAAGRFYHGNTDADIFNNISNGIAGTEMPGLFYSADRVWQIVAYIRSLHGSTEKATGNVENGAMLFRSKGCSSCHRIQGEGGALGPDLSAIGAARSIANLKQSLIDPDAEVEPQYWTVSFEDVAGSQVKGFLLNEDTYTVQLLDRGAQLHSYDKAAVKNFTVDKHSAMPSYRESLNAAQLNDLVAYLWSLRPE